MVENLNADNWPTLSILLAAIFLLIGYQIYRFIQRRKFEKRLRKTQSVIDLIIEYRKIGRPSLAYWAYVKHMIHLAEAHCDKARSYGDVLKILKAFEYHSGIQNLDEIILRRNREVLWDLANREPIMAT